MTKMIEPLGHIAMVPLITEETYVIVLYPCFPLAPKTIDKSVELEPEETISPPTTFQPSMTRKDPIVAATGCKPSNTSAKINLGAWCIHCGWRT